MLFLCLPMFALLYPSTILKQNSHVYSKGHTQQKRGVAGILGQSMYRGAKVFWVEQLLKTKGTLNDLEMLCNSSVLEAWRHYLITKPLVLVGSEKQVIFVICSVAHLIVLCNLIYVDKTLESIIRVDWLFNKNHFLLLTILCTCLFISSPLNPYCWTPVNLYK